MTKRLTVANIRGNATSRRVLRFAPVSFVVALTACATIAHGTQQVYANAGRAALFAIDRGTQRSAGAVARLEPPL